MATAFVTMGPAAAVEQPLPFSHKTHVDVAKLKCEECHPSPAKFGAEMGFPAPARCMYCHIEVAKSKLSIQKLAAIAKAKEPIPWVRIFTLPDFVYFDHRFHLQNGAACVDCHGPVAERDQVVDDLHATKMAFCQTCHVKMQAARGCNSCHDYR